MKKIIFFCFVLIFVFFIYLINIDNKIYYLTLGDNKGYSFYIKNYLEEKNILEKAVYNYSDSRDRITDIYLKIMNNMKSDKYYLKNSLIKTDLLSLKINIDYIYDIFNDESSNYIYNYIDDLSNDFEKLIILIRKYCKENIIFIGFGYSNGHNAYLDYLNKKFKYICNKYGVIFINDSEYLKRDIIQKIDKYLFES